MRGVVPGGLAGTPHNLSRPLDEILRNIRFGIRRDTARYGGYGEILRDTVGYRRGARALASAFMLLSDAGRAAERVFVVWRRALCRAPGSECMFVRQTECWYCMHKEMEEGAV